MPLNPSRREILAGTIGTAVGATLPGVPAFAAPSAAIPYGSCVRVDALTGDDAYRELVARECSILTAESEMKWDRLRPARGVYDFADADTIVGFAARQGMAMRGHTLAWYAALPDWTKEISSAAEAEAELVSHIETVVSRYKGVITSGDVVNEPVPDDPDSPAGLRPCVWTEHLGPDYIKIAFRAAAAADPRARLVVNDYDLEFAGARFDRRRGASARCGA